MSKKGKTEDRTNKKNLKRKGAIQSNTKVLWIGAIIIAVVTFLVYLPVFSNGFVNTDDDQYIEKQPLTQVINLKNCFSGFVEGNYHPLVMLLYSIIYHFFQLDARAYHLVNLFLHILNACLVLWLIFSITGSFPISFVVGILFGVHPMHVESVAWASELKDLMYTAGFLSALICYVLYIKENQSPSLYVLCLLFFLFSLFSKGMGVSLTVVLFLFDFYFKRKITSKVIIEKIPFFILSVVFGIIAIIAQKSSGALAGFQFFSFPQRVLFACYGFIFYITRLLVPVNLCYYNVYPVNAGDPIPVVYYIYPLLIVLLFVGVFYSLKRTRILFFGIGFFSITVFLVLQLLPVGKTITADRYTYIPSIGIFYLVAEGLVYLSKRQNQSSSFSNGAMGILGVYFLFLSFQAYNQVKVWKDSISLWNKVIENYPAVPTAYMHRGEAYLDMGDLDHAQNDFSHSMQMDSKSAEIWCNMGILYWHRELNDKSRAAEFLPQAINYFNKAIEIKPDFDVATCDRGAIFYSMGKPDDAIKDFTRSIEINPTYADPYYDRGLTYYNTGKKEEACSDFFRASELGFAHAKDAYRDLCK